MGLYLEPKMGGTIQTKLKWLESHGVRVNNGVVLNFAVAKREDRKHYCFHIPSQWGGSIAVANDHAELNRLAKSGVFDSIWLVDTDTLRSEGMRSL